MFAAARERILATLPDDALVLDVGGGAVPFPRADWVIDLVGFDERAYLGWEADPADARFSAATWVQRDICDREPWPFADKQFDFVTCSHTLEDVRDPIWVCSELIRVARAGYIEVPSRLDEQCFATQGPWTGWSHHHWIVEPEGDGLVFVFKHDAIHAPGHHLPAGMHYELTPEQRITGFWWEDAFPYRERIFLSAEELDAYFADFVRAHAPPAKRRRGRSRR